MWVGGQAAPLGVEFGTEVVERFLVNASLDEATRIDPWRSVALEVDMVAALGSCFAP